MGASDRRRKRRHRRRRPIPGPTSDPVPGPEQSPGPERAPGPGSAPGRERAALLADAQRRARACPKWIQGPQEAHALGEHLCSPARRRPALVVSTVPEDRRRLAFDLDPLLEEAGQEVEVYVIPNGVETYALTDAMPALTQVYGGAARIYPVDPSWMSDWRLSRLHMARDEGEARRSGAALLEELIAVAATCRLSRRPSLSSAGSPGSDVQGRVEGLVGAERALVRGSDGEVRTVALEASFPGLGVTIDQVLAPGQEVRGVESVRGFLDLSGSLRDGAAWIEELPEGAVALVRVGEVRPERMVVEPWPGVAVDVGLVDVTSSDLDRLTDLFWEGSVARARVHRGAGRLRLTLADVDDDDPLEPVPSLLPGGPPWLVEEGPAWERIEDREAADEGVPASAEWVQAIISDHVEAATVPIAPASTPSGVAAVADPLEEARQRANRLSRELSLEREARARQSRELKALAGALADEQRTSREAQREVQKLANRVHELMEGNRRSRDLARKQRGRPGSEVDPMATTEVFFTDPEQQFRHEVYLAWCRRIPASDKEQRQLPGQWALGPAFLASLEALTAVSRGKVLDVVVEVLTDLVREVPGRGVASTACRRRGCFPPADACRRGDSLAGVAAGQQSRCPSVALLAAAEGRHRVGTGRSP